MRNFDDFNCVFWFGFFFSKIVLYGMRLLTPRLMLLLYVGLLSSVALEELQAEVLNKDTNKKLNGFLETFNNTVKMSKIGFVCNLKLPNKLIFRTTIKDIISSNNLNLLECFYCQHRKSVGLLRVCGIRVLFLTSPIASR